PRGSANCSMVDGTVCGGVASADAGPPACGGGCCSRLCAPYGPTGVLVCQPASGCHVVGDACRQDSDCCYSAPGACNISPPNVLGNCRNPLSCKPNGDVCRLATMSCNASCDCCSGNCHKDTCRPDSVGVPRCTGSSCVGAGLQCSSSADCCNLAPCVPNPGAGSGGPQFVCSGQACVPACGACTINADCCAGESCIVPVGATQGTCGPCGGSGGDAGTCALYGQNCAVDSDCCDGVPCTSNHCQYVGT
ncbi:MAG TPA: hypothetical protein VKU41_24495, partial [Polyangiaceae bacterium]|nr:hypothetical protein [Polyangiaceae bacterium]